MSDLVIDFQKKHRDFDNPSEKFISHDEIEDIDIWVPKGTTIPLSIFERPETK